MTKQTYTEIVNIILRDGDRCAPRGKETHELLNASIQFTPTVMIGRRGMSKRLAWLESLMMVGGVFDLDIIAAVAPKANIELYRHQSDYGPRIYQQLLAAHATLSEDRLSRRAIIFLNDRDTPGEDCACTTSIQFLIRDDKLTSIVSMRSWDFVYGFPMDTVMFGFLTTMMGLSLGALSEKVIVNAGSLHIYDSTQHLAKEVSLPKKFYFTDVSLYNTNIEDISRYCRYGLNKFVDSGELPFNCTQEVVDAQQFQFSY